MSTVENKKIGIACDHAGYQMKEFLVGLLESRGYDVYDFGCHSEESCNYPEFAHQLAEAVESKELPQGIALCGSGNGISMTLNKHQSIRAALCWNVELAEMARLHNNANILSLPARYIDNEMAVEIVTKFLSTSFEGGRHEARVAMIPLQ